MNEVSCSAAVVHLCSLAQAHFCFTFFRVARLGRGDGAATTCSFCTSPELVRAQLSAPCNF